MAKTYQETIYSQECPACGSFNLPDAFECWNCHYCFPQPREEKTSLYTAAEKILISLTFLMTATVVVLRLLVF